MYDEPNGAGGPAAPSARTEKPDDVSAGPVQGFHRMLRMDWGGGSEAAAAAHAVAELAHGSLCSGNRIREEQCTALFYAVAVLSEHASVVIDEVLCRNGAIS